MLLREPVSFGHCTDNFPGTVPAALPGSAVVAGANNVDGTAVTLLSALQHDCHYLVVGIGGYNVSAGRGHALLDLLTDPAGGTSWGSWIDDLLAGYSPTPAAGTTGIQHWFHFPVWLPAGTSIGARARTAHTATLTGQVILQVYGEPNRPDNWWCGQKVETLGADAANSKGVDFVQANLAAGVWSTWTNIGTVTSYDYGAIQLGVSGTGTSATAVNYHYQMGYDSQPVPGSPTFWAGHSASEVFSRVGFNMCIWADIPAGKQMQARGKGSTTTQAHGGIIYGVAS